MYNMTKSKVWPAPPSVMRMKLNLLIDELEQLPGDMLQSCQNSSFMVQIEWKGKGRNFGFLHKVSTRNFTSRQHIQANGVICWNEAFDYTCKIRKTDSQNYKSWIINLEIQEFNRNLGNRIPILGRAMVDIAELVNSENETSMRIPIKCDVRGHAAGAAVLTVKLQFIKLQKKGSTPYTLTRALSLGTFSCTRHPPTGNTKLMPTIDQDELSNYSLAVLSSADSSADDENEMKCREDNKGTSIQKSQDKVKQPPSLLRLLSLDRSKLSFKMANHLKGESLRQKQTEKQNGEKSPLPRIQDIHRTDESGSWGKQRVISRDGKMELSTEIFFASIDQRDQKAAGGNACTVLAAVIADWLHKNPNILPQRPQFDDLVHEGSSEWRKLCSDKDHKNNFSDQHFDLDTVLEAKIRNLSVITEKSYIGFFRLRDMIDEIGFLEGAMSFDTIWKELLCSDTSEGRVYITGWNDHFFVLKVEREAIYLIDTLGERLFEGCNQAYILKFQKESTIHRRQTDDGSQTENFNKCTGEEEKDYRSSKEVLCTGIACCKEYIKEFLAALPLRELEQDIQRGLVKKTLHQRLQIEFHYTVPCTV
ncbi:hypothetical protein J5N97_006053 [Dioscorea zingiberensis]|uniref:C2 NT-type domain-containing protein n=1 Tax=Dioscorea zingiberensis TaxID=325984 RepID=A0A9D5DCC3_9LILI|nr:hypothetical protein J5N97_006053 [Dioscorea zingiberensis]